MKLSKRKKSKLHALLDICQKHQGEHLKVTHGSGSWATTYSNEFIDAAASIYNLYKKSGFPNPIHQLSQDFQHRKIRSCRGSKMDEERVKYLFKTHLESKV
jgi:hypothetical protein